MRHITKYLLLAAVAVFTVASCQKKDPTPEPQPIALKGISVSPTSLTMDIGETAKVTIKYNPENATVIPPAVWSSSKAAVASVSEGTVTAVAAGVATITVKVGDYSANVEVTVKDVVPPEPQGLIKIDGDFSDWAEIEAVGAGNHKEFKCAIDDNYIYFFTWRDNKDEDYAQIWGNKDEGYIYIALDTDKDPTTGVDLWGNGPYEFVGYHFPFGGTPEAPAINENPGANTSCAPSTAKVKNIYCKGVVDADGARIEYRIPRADLPEIPSTPFIVYSWGSLGLDKVEYHVGEPQPEPASIITIDGDMSDWDEIEGASQDEKINAALKVVADDKYVYFYNMRTTERMSDLWGGNGYIYYAFELDGDPETGEILNDNGPYDMIFFFFPFATEPNIEIAKNGGSAPAAVSLSNIIVNGAVSDAGIEVEARIPRADLLDIPETPVKVYAWSNKGGGDKLVVEVTL